MYVFAGSASVSLARKIASGLNEPLGDVEIKHFANDEMRVWVKTTNPGRTAVVVQAFSAPVDSNIVEFCFLTDALYRLGVHDITAVIPWLGYSKQDKVFRPGEALSVKVVAKMIQVVPLSKIITFDLHNLAILGFFDIPVTNISAQPLFIEYFKKRISSDTVVVAPDEGAVKNSTSFAGALGLPVAYMNKSRDLVTGKVAVWGISRNVAGADILIIDDMIATGSTLAETAKYLKKEKVKSIAVAATHHLYVPGAEAIIEKNGIDEVVVTDTVSRPESEKSEKLKVLTVAPLLSRSLEI